MSDITLPNAIAMMRSAIETVSGLSATLTPLSFQRGNMIMPDIDCTKYALAIPRSGGSRTRGRDELGITHTVTVSFAVATDEESDALLEAVAVETLIINGMMRRDLMFDETNGSLEVLFTSTARGIVGNQYLMTTITFAVVADMAITYEVVA